MSQLFTLPKQVAISASGQPYANATATFYRAGTSTLQTVYSTPDLANPHTNPVVADAAGMFPAIWLDDLSPYRYSVIIRDANGALLQSESLAGSLSSSTGNVVIEAPQAGSSLEINQTSGNAYGVDGLGINSASGIGNIGSITLRATGVRGYRIAADTDNGYLTFGDETGVAVRATLNPTGVWDYFGAAGNLTSRFYGGTNSWGGIGIIDGQSGSKVYTLASGLSGIGAFSIFDNLLNAVRFNITTAGATTVSDGSGNLYAVGYADIPRLTSGFTAGKCTALTAGATINTSDLYTGKTFSIYNDSAAPITITEGAGVTMRLDGTATTGNRTLALRGIAKFWCNSATEVIGYGASLT